MESYVLRCALFGNKVLEIDGPQAIAMVVCRNVNAGVVIPLVLAFGIGVLVYLYGTSRSQHNILVGDMKELQKEMANVRSEKESLQHDLNTIKDELERVSKAKNEALEKVETAEGKATQADQEKVCHALSYAKLALICLFP